jgi:hypothetical protein
MTNYTIVLDEQEAQVLINLLDSAVRHVGLSAAGSAFALFQKIQNAASVEGAEFIEGKTE